MAEWAVDELCCVLVVVVVGALCGWCDMLFISVPVSVTVTD